MPVRKFMTVGGGRASVVARPAICSGGDGVCKRWQGRGALVMVVVGRIIMASNEQTPPKFQVITTIHNDSFIPANQEQEEEDQTFWRHQ
ncbi:hypothetical protein RHMOL_Rhmol07G0282200 [Rhododendron molle]|uniref:Uncharacterized protein n=1 Tax=Rhododendron molle TaxID=49168 RepID=A0ACC0N651_RHOML|nr:hypothetical protein RHMOL_Rhmol07G0282200 [Rhododendron molle]